MSTRSSTEKKKKRIELKIWDRETGRNIVDQKNV